MVTDFPLIATACFRKAEPFLPLQLVDVEAVEVGSAEDPSPFSLRLCLLFGLFSSSSSGIRVVAFNLSTNSFFGECRVNVDFRPQFPNQAVLYDYQPVTVPVATCPRAWDGSMPAELQGNGATRDSVIPIDLPIPGGLSGLTVINSGMISQEFLLRSIITTLCSFSYVALTEAAPGGTVPPPLAPPAGSARATSFGWWRVQFADPVEYANTSTCALMARVPSLGKPLYDDLTIALGHPGKPCPVVWSGSTVEKAVSFEAFYTALPIANKAVSAAVSWGQLALTLALSFVAMSFAPQ